MSPSIRALLQGPLPVTAPLVLNPLMARMVEAAGFRPGRDRFVVEMALEIGSQPVGRLVTAAAVFLQALHHDPVQIPANLLWPPT